MNVKQFITRLTELANEVGSDAEVVVEDGEVWHFSSATMDVADAVLYTPLPGRCYGKYAEEGEENSERVIRIW